MSNITTSFILGARIIEKHFTLNKKLKGNDHYHSMDINDLKKLKSSIKDIHISIGKKEKNFLNSEINSRKFARRSVIARKLIKKDQIITKNDLICKRPGTGIEPEKINDVIGKRAKKNLKEDYIIKLRDIS